MLKEKAKQVLDLLEKGGYHNKAGNWVDISDARDFAVNHSQTYTPETI